MRRFEAVVRPFAAALALLLAGVLLTACSSSPKSGTAGDPPGSAAAGEASGNGPVLDGREKSILVNGYSTSYAWPAMLQDMLDEHAGNRRVYHVVNAVVGGAPVESWIAAPGTRDYERTIVAMERDFFGDNPRLLGVAPRPTIVICQQSLQLTRDQRGPVKEASDMVGAEMGADAFEKLALRLREYGAERIYIATHIYKEPVEPEVGNERIALGRLMMRGHDFIHRGPDVWTPTRNAYPEAFEEDGVHPNHIGMKIMAEAWYRTLAGDAAKSNVIARMWAREYDVDAMMREYLAWRRGE